MNYEKWIWVELSAFDNSQKDLGVSKYLDNLNFKPDGIFIDIRYPEFVHQHYDLEADNVLEYKYSSVYELFRKQSWRKFQLRDFVREFQKNDVKVFISLMTFLITGQRESGLSVNEWIDAHSEIKTVDKFGTVYPWINPLKRLKNGQFYEDIFIEKLAKVIINYGFDGFHAADGFTNLHHIPISIGDYSDDIIDQFCTNIGSASLEKFREKYDRNPELLKKRADTIWNDHKLEWIQFHTQRWAIFWEKLTLMCKQNKKMIIMNLTITQDPYEAIYRYGFDFKKIENIGIDAAVAVTIGSPTVLGGYVQFFADEKKRTGDTIDTRKWIEDAASMILTIKAYVPSIKIISLWAIQDKPEQYDSMFASFSLLEKEIFSYCSTFYINEKGKYKRCLDGILFCLGDDVPGDDWAKLIKISDSAFSLASLDKLRPLTVTAVWSDNLFKNQVKEIASIEDKPVPTLHSYIKDLTHENAIIRSIIRIENIKYFKGPLLLINPGFETEDNIKLYDKWLSEESLDKDLIIIGEDLYNFSSYFTNLDFNKVNINEVGSDINISCLVISKKKNLFIGIQGRNKNDFERINLVFAKEGSPSAIIEIKKNEDSNARFTEESVQPCVTNKNIINRDPMLFLEQIEYSRASKVFLSVCSSIINSIVLDGIKFEIKPEEIKIFILEEVESNIKYLYIENVNPVYLRPHVLFDNKIKSLKTISSFPKVPIYIDMYNAFDVQITPNGISILEVEFEYIH